jgi:N-acetylglucosaminyl-diphospho-decaprenol L-rhamnosyltransferase
MDASLDIVIVNWNTGAALAECVVSVVAASAALGTTRIVVVDNASSDGSLDAALARIPTLTAIRNAENRGFAAGCNQGAAGSRADYLLFLNPDTVLRPDTLARVIGFMEARGQAEVGICGIRLTDAAGAPTTVAARFPTLGVIAGETTGLARLGLLPRHLLSPDECRETRNVDQVIGAFFFVRRAVFDALSGFDERFFVYFEEVDFALRARQRGWRSVYFAGAAAIHHGGVSSGQVRAARLFYSLRSRLLFVEKHASQPAARLVHALTWGIERPLRMLRARAGGPAVTAETLEAYRRLAAFVAAPDWRSSRALQRQP